MKPVISHRVSGFQSAEIMEFFNKTAGLSNPVDLSIGVPYARMTASATRAAIKALNEGRTRYIRAGGLNELREAVAAKLSKRNRITATAKNTIITPGVSGGLYLAMAAILDPGDEVIIPDPFFLAYRELAVLMDAVPVYLDTYPTFELNPDRVLALVTPKTKAIIINTPNNPAGTIYSRKSLVALADICKKNGLVVISDEVYEDFAYDQEHTSIGEFYQPTITLNGYSKNHSMAGMRIGYAHSTHEIIEAMTELEQFVFFSNTSISEYAALAVVGEDTSERIRPYAQNRDFICDYLDPRYERSSGDGSFFFFIKHPTLNGRELAEQALERELVVIPGDIFSLKKSHFRISYATDLETLSKGIKILNAML